MQRPFLNHFPWVGAALIFCVLLAAHAKIICWSQAGQIDLANLYSAIFGWASIQTGFLFTVYGAITARKDGFLGAIERTSGMRFFKKVLARAIFAGFFLSLSSVPLIVFPLTPEAFDFWYVVISAWFSLFLWAFLLFCRVAYTFGIISQVRDNTDLPAQ
ncbi:MAG: hypothetical protein WEB57_08180 [Pseudohongiellaceae bacterium]